MIENKVYIKSAAIKIALPCESGMSVFYGRTHGDCLKQLKSSSTQGFVASDEKMIWFVNRKDALKIAIAAKQIHGEKYAPLDELTSEDVYNDPRYIKMPKCEVPPAPASISMIGLAERPIVNEDEEPFLDLPPCPCDDNCKVEQACNGSHEVSCSDHHELDPNAGCTVLPKWQEFRKKIEDFRVMAAAERTGCLNNETRPINLEMKVYWSAITKAWWVVICNGVTGYESLMFELFADPARDKGWWACAGTKNSWDKLFIPKESIKEVVIKFKEVTRDLLDIDIDN